MLFVITQHISNLFIVRLCEECAYMLCETTCYMSSNVVQVFKHNYLCCNHKYSDLCCCRKLNNTMLFEVTTVLWSNNCTKLHVQKNTFSFEIKHVPRFIKSLAFNGAPRGFYIPKHKPHRMTQICPALRRTKIAWTCHV